MFPFLKISGYVLAGGGSTRFGRDKALAEVGGAPMLQRMAGLLRRITKQVKIVATQGKYSEFGCEMIEDAWPGEGPLGGIVTALEDAAKDAAQPEWSLIVSCDMPFLTREWLAFLCERALLSEAHVVIPQSAHGLEPLCACWRTNSLPILQEQFDAGARKVTEAMKPLRREVLDEKDWKRFDTAGRLFWNMNTQADYDEARRIVKEESR